MPKFNYYTNIASKFSILLFYKLRDTLSTDVREYWRVNCVCVCVCVWTRKFISYLH
jgi:hypothetical protein